MSYNCRFKLKVEGDLVGFLGHLKLHGGETSKYAIEYARKEKDGWVELWDGESFTWYSMDEDIAEAMKATTGPLTVTVHLESTEDGPYVCDYVFNLWENEGRDPGVTIDRYEYKIVRCDEIAERRHL